MEKNRSNLDERQEQTLLRIEHNGCWLAFWGLAVAVVVQQFFGDMNFKSLAGEMAVFLALALYLVVGCIRQGIWDRRLKPDTSSNLIVALVAALVSGAVSFLVAMKRFPGRMTKTLVIGLVCAGIAYAVCFAVLQLMSVVVRKRQAKLERELPESDER